MADAYLQEDGFKILQEDDTSLLLLESSSSNYQAPFRRRPLNGLITRGLLILTLYLITR